MGRQPNPLITRYFNRGAKIDDNSNRYEHTCKSCGELFPKGRVEVLSTHILKKCRSISTETRQQLVLEVHGFDRPTTFAQHQGQDSFQQNSIRKDKYNGLNVLAEASRRVGTSHGSLIRSYIPFNVGENASLPIDPSIDVDDFASSILNISDDRIDPKDSSPTPLGPGLESIAVSANGVMNTDGDLGLSDIPISDDLLQDNNTPVMPENGADMTPPADSIAWQPSVESSNASLSENPRPLAIHPSPKSAHFIPESGTPVNSATKPKVRAKFSPGRREQVKKMRQLGACLRCQRLKKPCDTGTPCQNCASVENPRRWKDKCVRKKPVDQKVGG